MIPPAEIVDSVVISTRGRGCSKSLYAVCEALTGLGQSAIGALQPGTTVATWFHHQCLAYDYSYVPDVLIYPELHQVHYPEVKHHICFVQGRFSEVEAHASLAVFKSPGTLSWARARNPRTSAALIPPGIDRQIFDYDGRPKKEIICFMPRPHRYPETGQRLREQHGAKVVDILGRSEVEVAELLKEAKVFVWRGSDKDGSPRPPREALAAGCVVVGLETDLNDDHGTTFGLTCSSVDELVQRAGEALDMPIPSQEERSVIRDKKDELRDWVNLIKQL